VLNVQRLLRVKPEVNDLLVKMFDEPIVDRENAVARVYYGAYLAAEKVAKTYRLVLYVLCVGLAALIGYAVHRLRQTARTLEENVVERTRDLRAVLDNVEEALLTVTADGRLAGDPSATFSRWFPHARAGDHLWQILSPLDAEASSWLAVGWEQLGEETLPLDVALDQLPASFCDGGSRRHYRIGYRPMGDAARPELFLVVISDVTTDVERLRREADQQDHLMLFQQVMVDGGQFEESFGEMERLVHRILDRDHADRYSLARTLHTIKGNAGMYGLSSLTTLCHDLESRMDDGQRDPTAEELDQLGEAWAALAGRVRALLRLTQSDRLAITAADLAQVRHAVSGGRAPGELLYALTYLEREPVARRFERFAEQARHVAARLGKGEVIVEVDAEGLRLDARRWTPFWASFVHLLRNALDHGLETPDERRRAGKGGPGHLKLLARDSGGQVLIEVIDDGRGINWDAVRAKAEKRGLAASTTAELATALLEGGLSTKSETTLYSGRGAGLSASYRACCELGGHMTITSELGRGTTFRLLIPGDDGAALPLDPAELRAARGG
jgi:two-component system chemotaxis sensor kinase CheA